MLIEVQGSGDNTYTVDTDKVTCTCPNFRYRCTYHTIDAEERLCKHLAKVYQDRPELKPIEMIQAENSAIQSVGTDGKMRYPRAVFDYHVGLIRSVLRSDPSVLKFEVCGSYRRQMDMVSDLDFLIVLKDNQSWDHILDLFENIHQFKIVPEIGRGQCKAGYIVDNFIRVDFKTVSEESWPFALLHFTGSKTENIEMRRVASRRGLKLNEYGLFDSETEVPVDSKFESEEDIYKYLNLKYKYPWER